MTCHLQLQQGRQQTMPTYNVDIIHEPTGNYMNFNVESDETEERVWNEILHDLSIVVIGVVDDD